MCQDGQHVDQLSAHLGKTVQQNKNSLFQLPDKHSYQCRNLVNYDSVKNCLPLCQTACNVRRYLGGHKHHYHPMGLWPDINEENHKGPAPVFMSHLFSFPVFQNKLFYFFFLKVVTVC